MNIDIHADDYALTINTSRDMLKCMKAGKLDSISIVANTSCFAECMDMLYEAIPELPFLPKLSVHVDLVEGLKTFQGELPEAMVQKTEDGRILLNMTWSKIYLWSWILSHKNPISIGIADEVKAQIDKCQAVIEKCIGIARENNIPCAQEGLRIDSHQHAHMIPIVWRGCVKAVENGNYKIEYIRNSHEPLKVFLDNKEFKKTYRPVNIVKNRILAMHSKKVDKYCDKNGLERMYLWGLIMSGRMDRERISGLLPAVKEVAQKDNRTLEILFHPGSTLPEELNGEVKDEAARDFYLSEGRQIEMDAVMNCEMHS